jgi:alanyl-tRNA synthetase
VTEKLYWRDPALLSFEARVTAVVTVDGRCAVELDRTAFYPGGGGQPADTGTLGSSRVVEMKGDDGQILHVVEPPLPASLVGSTLKGEVDEHHRRDYMVQHTGQHMFSQALVRAGKLETVSVHFGPEDTTVEVAADTVDERTLRAAEDIVNEVIRENRPVILHEVDPSEAGRFPLRRTPPDAGRLRIVEVEGFEWAACGGVHVSRTGEVFLVKATAVEKIRGHARIHLLIGRRAMEDYNRKSALAASLAKSLTCGEPFVLERVNELIAREKEATRELKRLRVAQAASDADDSVAASQGIGGALVIRRVFDTAGSEYLKAFVERVVAVPGRFVIAVDREADGFQWIAAHSLAPSLDLAAMLTGLFEAAGVKGGGRGGRIQGRGARAADAAGWADAVESALARQVG